MSRLLGVAPALCGSQYDQRYPLMMNEFKRLLILVQSQENCE